MVKLIQTSSDNLHLHFISYSGSYFEPGPHLTQKEWSNSAEKPLFHHQETLKLKHFSPSLWPGTSALRNYRAVDKKKDSPSSFEVHLGHTAELRADQKRTISIQHRHSLLSWNLFQELFSSLWIQFRIMCCSFSNEIPVTWENPDGVSKSISNQICFTQMCTSLQPQHTTGQLARGSGRFCSMSGLDLIGLDLVCYHLQPLWTVWDLISSTTDKRSGERPQKYSVAGLSSSFKIIFSILFACITVCCWHHHHQKLFNSALKSQGMTCLGSRLNLKGQ